MSCHSHDILMSNHCNFLCVEEMAPRRTDQSNLRYLQSAFLCSPNLSDITTDVDALNCNQQSAPLIALFCDDDATNAQKGIKENVS